MKDVHVHSELSYCAERGLTADFYAKKIESGTLPESTCVTDHSMAIYFPEEIAWSWEFIFNSSIFDKWRDTGNEKLAKHIASLKPFSRKAVFVGIETELMHDGRLCFDEAFRKDLDIIIGSVHFLPELPREEILSSWLSHSKRLINSGIDVLGHPFRWIAPKIEIGEEIVKEIVKEAKNASVTLELNSHYKHPREDIMMLNACNELGAEIVIASDSHRKEQFGDYSYHAKIIEETGFKFPLFPKT